MEKTYAIVLYMQAYNDKASILNVYTPSNGRSAYILYGNKRNKKKNAAYTPLSLIEITTNHARPGTMPVVKEIQLKYVPQRISNDIRRSAIAMFIAEVLTLSLKHPMADETLYNYIEHTIYTLDKEDNPVNIHINFLIDLATLLGIGIDHSTHARLLREPSTRKERQTQLHELCQYFEAMIEDFHTPKSLDVLMTIFD